MRRLQLKHEVPICFTLSGNVILVRELHSWKQLFPIDVTLSGILILSSKLSFIKVFNPILTNVDGRVTLVNDLQLKNVLFSSLVTPFWYSNTL